MTDKDIINKYSKYKSIRKSIITSEENAYLLHRYNNCDDSKESIYRILNNIEILPKCPYCDKYVHFFSWGYGYTKTCGNKEHISRYKKEHTSFNNPETQLKVKETIKERYGVENIFNLPIIKEHCKIASQSKETKEKRNKTILSKYGTDNVWKNENIKNKIRNTIKTKYGDNAYNKGGKIFNKQTSTCLLKYGVPRYQNTTKFKQHLSEISEISINKRKNTCIKLYGISTFNNQEKRNKTMKENNSYARSKTEDIAYLYLSLVYPDTIRQYRDEKRYPFNCDFYIPCLDLFIECNFHWTHGNHLFNPNSKEDQDKLYELQHKNGKYYENAGTTWTKRDPLKVKTAKQNNLNYKIFWNLDELIKWLK